MYSGLPEGTYDLTGNYLLLLLYLGCTTNQRSIPFGYHLHLLVQHHQSSSVFSEVFLAEEVDGVGGKGSGDMTMTHAHTLLGTF
jgi:hypothetical protein